MPLFCKQCKSRRLPKSVIPENKTLWLCEKCKNFVNSEDFIVREAKSNECEDSQEDYKKFLRLYARDILRPGKKEYYTEKQLYDDGPFLIDLDFRYDFGIKTRQHTQDHVESFIADVLEFLKNAYQMDDDTNFQVFVLQKDSVNCVQEKQITKMLLNFCDCFYV